MAFGVTTYALGTFGRPKVIMVHAMGYQYAQTIEHAAMFLLRVLEEKGGSVPYSTFYDGTKATEDWLEQSLELSDGDGAEGLMDLAAAQLAEQGVVSMETLNSKLSDGENDYLNGLTEEGVRWFTERYPLRFYTSE